MYSLFYNERKSDNFGMIITGLKVPPPERRVETVQIPGRDGTLYQTSDNLEDIDIEVTFARITPENEFEKWYLWFDDVKRWLMSRAERLEIGVKPNGFWKVKAVSISTPERTAYISSTFTAKFSCDPYFYLRIGEAERALASGTQAVKCPCNPTYIIKSSNNVARICTLTVNGNAITVTTSTNVVIDTDKMVIYSDTAAGKVWASSSVAGATVEKLRMVEGNNTVTVSGTATLTYKPNWRET